VTQYWLYVGTTPGNNDLYSQPPGLNLTGTVTGLPTDGRQLYVRLWSLIGGVWQFNDYTYTAATAVTFQTLPVRLTIVAPPEAVDLGSQIVFIGDLNGETVPGLATSAPRRNPQPRNGLVSGGRSGVDPAG